jgi:hypothetical protein
MSDKELEQEENAVAIRSVEIANHTFMKSSDVKKIAAAFQKISENEKAAVTLLLKTARLYFDAGNILASAVKRWKVGDGKLTVKNVAEATGFPERRITLSLKIFKHFEHNPAILDDLSLRDALKLIAPPPPSGEDGYNRVDLGGDAGQAELDFGGLFELPPSANQALKNYRTIGDMLTEIVVVRRTDDNHLISKRFAQFSEDIPQNPQLRMAYKTMAQKTQAAIEDYLAVMEEEEGT